MENYEKRLKEVEKNHTYDDPIPQDIGFLRYVLNSNSELLQKKDMISHFTTEDVCQDPELIKILIKKFPYNLPLQYASEEIKNNREIVKLAVEDNTSSLAFASIQLRNDKEIVTLAVNHKTNAYGLQYIGEDLKKDREFFNEVSLIAINNDYRALGFASEDIRNDPEICLSVIEKNGLALKHTNENFRDNKDYVLTAIKSSPSSLEFASDRLKNDREVVIAAIEIEGQHFKYASAELRNDKALGILALNQSKYYSNKVLECLSEELKNNKEVVLIGMTKCALNFMYASESIRSDLDMVKIALTLDKANIDYINKDLKEEIGNGNALEYIENKILFNQMQNSVLNKNKPIAKKKI